MIELVLYGKPSYSYEYVKTAILKEAGLAQIEVDMTEIMDTHKFIEDNITSIPAVRIGNVVRSQGTENIKSFSKDICNWMLTQENYGEMKKLIIPTDFSDCSKNAANYAINLSKEIGAAIDLLHIYHPGPRAVNGEIIIDPMSREVKEQQLSRFADNLKNELTENDKRVYVNSKIIQGFAADEIIELSNDLSNAMIVMGNTGNSKLQKKFFGSVSTKVAKYARKPVLIIPPDAKFKAWDNILYCSNDLSLDTAVFNKLVEHAEMFGATVHLIHVNTNSNSNYNELNLIKLYQNFYPKSKIKFSELVTENPIEAIQNYSSENEIDLVAMATLERSFFGELFHKSFTKEMASNTKIPLLILHK